MRFVAREGLVAMSDLEGTVPSGRRWVVEAGVLGLAWIHLRFVSCEF